MLQNGLRYVRGVKPYVTGVKPYVTGVKPYVTGVKPYVTRVKPCGTNEVLFARIYWINQSWRSCQDERKRQ